jgi:uncharacterized protein YlzI (FlbEa/FlbD family)
MKKLYSPNNDSELALIKSILDGEGIQYFVHNDHFGTLKVGPRIELLNAKTIMVAEKHYEVSKGIIDDFLKNIQEASENTKPKYSIRDKIRMVIEAILFTWFIPGNRWTKRKPKG